MSQGQQLVKIAELHAKALDDAALETIHGGQARSRRWLGGGRSIGFDLVGFGRGTVRSTVTVDSHTVTGNNLTIDGSRILDQSGNVVLEH